MYIKLSSDIVVSKETRFYCPVTLDLNDCAIQIDALISFLGTAAGSSRLTDHHGTYDVSGTAYEAGDAFYFDNPNSILLADGALYGAADINRYSGELLYHEYNAYINSVISERVRLASTPGQHLYADLLGSFGVYADKLSLAAGDNTSITGGLLYATVGTLTHGGNFSYRVEGYAAITKYFKIIGSSGEAVWDSIVTQYLPILTSGAEISYSICLPEEFKDYNCTVEWWSSDSSVLSHTGIYRKTVANKLYLLATVTMNDSTFVKRYDITTESLSNEEKLRYLINRWGAINFSTVGQEQEIPAVSTYQEATETDLGITNISYSFDSAYTFLEIYDLYNHIDGSFMSTQLRLRSSTGVKYVPLSITVIFENDPENPKTGIIDVIIIFTGGGETEAAFNYVETFMKTDLYGGFQLPEIYDELLITYYLPNDLLDLREVDIVDDAEILNTTNAYLMTSITNGYVSINLNYATTSPTAVRVIVEIAGNRRVMTFGVGTVIKYLEDGTGEIGSSAVAEALKTRLGITDRNYITTAEIAASNAMANQTLTVGSTASPAIVTSLVGLEYFTSLTELNVYASTASSPRYTDMSNLSALVNLVTLRLHGGDLTSISAVESMPNLKTLEVRDSSRLININPISKLGLTYLNVNGTGVTQEYGNWAILMTIYNAYNTFDFSTYKNSYILGNGSNLAIQTGSNKEQGVLLPLSRVEEIAGPVYDTLIVPAGYARLTGDNTTYTYQWHVGRNNNNAIIYNNGYISFTNAVSNAASAAVISRPTEDTEIVIFLRLAAHSNISNFGVDRPFFFTLKAAGAQ